LSGKEEASRADRHKGLPRPADEAYVAEPLDPNLNPNQLNRRAQSRTSAPPLQRIEVTVAEADGGPRKLAAVLVDFSATGLGLDMFVPLKIGSQVDVHGDLQSDELTLCVDGNARVAHSRRLPGGNYRIGLALHQIAYRKTA
jgi:c-di-GMP-binding flagellar brake protein YcgR